MSKYTKGPWRYYDGPIGVIQNDEGKQICHMVYLVDEKFNAGLIASAPDTYEALLDVLSVLQRNERLDSIAWKEALQKAQAVITKVENGE